MKGTVTVIGLGYVGFPLACAIAKSKKYKVFGYTRNKKTADLINQKDSPIDDNVATSDIKKVEVIATTNPKECLPLSDYIIVCVPTPVYKNHNPDLRPIINTSNLIAKYLKKSQSIILESTVNPGVCEEVILPILEKSCLKGGCDFELSHCPERINPGDPKWNVYNIPRNVGSLTKKGCKETVSFYRSFLTAPVYEMASLKEVESTKMVENAFRDINIAFVNELAKSFDRMGINITNVIKGASNKPFAFIPHYPGCGVGGHCIAVDPYYLIEKAKTYGFVHKLMKTARQINNSMPEYTVNLLLSAFKKKKKRLKDYRIGILGITYKPNIADTRESPALEVIKLLKKFKAKIEIFDPYVKDLSTVDTLDKLLAACKAIIICTSHDLFVKALTGKKLKSYHIEYVIDGRNCLNMTEIKKQGIYYKGIGR